MTDVASLVGPDTVDEPTLTTRLAMTVTFQEAFKRAKTVIAPLNTQGRQTPIFWIHSVVGSGTDPIKLSMLLGSDQPFYSIRAPNDLRNKAFGGSVEGMADRYIAELIRLKPTGPIILGAWSAGVVVVLEMAQKLKAAGREVSHLIAVDFAPFNTGPDCGPLAKLMRKAEFLVHKVRMGTWSCGLAAMQIWRWAAEASQSLSYEHPSDRWTRHLRLTDDETGFVRAFHDAVEAYTPKCYDGSVLLYTALRSGTANIKTHRPLKHGIIERWKVIASNLATVDLVGDHMSIMIGDNVGGLASDLIPRLFVTATLSPVNSPKFEEKSRSVRFLPDPRPSHAASRRARQGMIQPLGQPLPHLAASRSVAAAVGRLNSVVP